jgi:hypothetical protein
MIVSMRPGAEKGQPSVKGATQKGEDDREYKYEC